MPILGQGNTEGPSNEKAQKASKDALACLHQRQPELALQTFKKNEQAEWGILPGLPEANDQVSSGGWRLEGGGVSFARNGGGGVGREAYCAGAVSIRHGAAERGLAETQRRTFDSRA